MGSTVQEQLIGLFVFFLTLNTIAVGLRLYVRLRLKSAAFGWDDVFLTITYIGLSLHVAFSLVAMHYGVIALDVQPWYNPVKAKVYTAMTCDVCFIISGTVKISVALVIYRLLEYRPVLKAIVVADIVICCIWTVVYTLVLSLGCSGTRTSPVKIDPRTCENVMYAQEATYIIFSIFQVVFPVALLWNTQIRRRHKWAVIILFSLGGLSTIAVVLKLFVMIELYHPGPASDYRDLWGRGNKWATVEHGLSLLAASVLAVGPALAPLARGWAALSARLAARTRGRGPGRRHDGGLLLPPAADDDDDGAWGWGWGWAGSRRNSDRELVPHAAAMPGAARGAPPAPAYAPPGLAGSRTLDWDGWAELADGGASSRERAAPWCRDRDRDAVAPHVRPDTSDSCLRAEATDISCSL